MLRQYKSMIGVNSCRGALDISPWEPITMAIGMAAYRKTTRFWADPNISAGNEFVQAGNESVQGAQKKHHMKQN